MESHWWHTDSTDRATESVQIEYIYICMFLCLRGYDPQQVTPMYEIKGFEWDHTCNIDLYLLGQSILTIVVRLGTFITLNVIVVTGYSEVWSVMVLDTSRTWLLWSSRGCPKPVSKLCSLKKSFKYFDRAPPYYCLVKNFKKNFKLYLFYNNNTRLQICHEVILLGGE